MDNRQSQLSPDPVSRRAYFNAYYHKTKEARFPLLAAAARAYRQRNPEKVKLWNKAYRVRNRTTLALKTQQRHEAIRRVINSYKNKPCTDCQGWYQPYQMHFDHRDPRTKSFNISGAARHLGSLIREIRKCDLVCANCHAVRTHKLIESGRFSRMVKAAMTPKDLF